MLQLKQLQLPAVHDPVLSQLLLPQLCGLTLLIAMVQHCTWESVPQLTGLNRLTEVELQLVDTMPSSRQWEQLLSGLAHVQHVGVKASKEGVTATKAAVEGMMAARTAKPAAVMLDMVDLANHAVE